MRWPALFLLLLLLAVLQYRLWFAEGSLAERTRLERQVESQTDVNRELRARNSVLEREVLELQTGNSTVEQRAREQLGLVRKGEIYYQIIAPAAVGQIAQEPAAESPASRMPEAAAGEPGLTHDPVDGGSSGDGGNER